MPSKHKLINTGDHAIKVKDVYESILRFYDKELVRAARGIRKSIYRHCFNEEYCIATGDGLTFNRNFLREEFALFSIKEDNYWLPDKTRKLALETGVGVGKFKEENSMEPQGGDQPFIPTTIGEGNPPVPEQLVKAFQTLIIPGKVPLERYAELFNYFIAQFISSGNRLKMEMKFEIHNAAGSPLDESKPLHKNVKEAAKQLGLGFDGE